MAAANKWGVNYQGICTSDGVPVANQTISILVQIKNDSSSGAIRYTETHSTTTNDNGMFSIQIFRGVSTDSLYSDVFYKPIWMSLSIDTNGGTNYMLIGTSELLSVPSAFYAKESSFALKSDTAKVSLKTETSHTAFQTSTLIIQDLDTSLYSIRDFVQKIDTIQYSFTRYCITSFEMLIDTSVSNYEYLIFDFFTEGRIIENGFLVTLTSGFLSTNPNGILGGKYIDFSNAPSGTFDPSNPYEAVYSNNNSLKFKSTLSTNKDGFSDCLDQVVVKMITTKGIFRIVYNF